jgi:hypothetical protein
MRVPKGTLPHDTTDAVEDWDALVARAKGRAVEEDAVEWDSVIAAARARAADEEREWAEAVARARRIAGTALSLVGKQRQRPPRKQAASQGKRASPPPVSAAASPSTLLDDEEAEWQRVRAQAALRLREEPRRLASNHVAAPGVFAMLSVISAEVRPTLRVVAWP